MFNASHSQIGQGLGLANGWATNMAMENYNMGAMLDVIMAFFGFSAVSWKEDFGLKLGQAIHLGQVVEQPPEMGI